MGMMLQVDFWQLLGTAGSVLALLSGATFAAGKILIGQFIKGMDDRFAMLEKARNDGQTHWNSKFAALERLAQDEALEWQRLERELLAMKADLPTNYVRREDHIRGQAVIEAKLDGLAMRYENLLLKGDKGV